MANLKFQTIPTF